MKDHKSHYKVIVWFLFALITSVLPHPANCSALLPTAFIIGIYCRPLLATIFSLMLAVTINFLLSHVYNYPFISSWLYFSMSGIVVVTLMGLGSQISLTRIVQFSVVYWTWSNLYV